jgi:hypothetical protein
VIPRTRLADVLAEIDELKLGWSAPAPAGTAVIETSALDRIVEHHVGDFTDRGAPRDLALGMTVALSDGTLARSGGKVIKNVAGYDVGKLLTGAFGTLGVRVAGWRHTRRRRVAANLPATGAEAIAAANPGCAFQIAAHPGTGRIRPLEGKPEHDIPSIGVDWTPSSQPSAKPAVTTRGSQRRSATDGSRCSYADLNRPAGCADASAA